MPFWVSAFPLLFPAFALRFRSRTSSACTNAHEPPRLVPMLTNLLGLYQCCRPVSAGHSSLTPNPLPSLPPIPNSPTRATSPLGMCSDEWNRIVVSTNTCPVLARECKHYGLCGSFMFCLACWGFGPKGLQTLRSGVRGSGNEG
jgi:hypothetical protein